MKKIVAYEVDGQKFFIEADLPAVKGEFVANAGDSVVNAATSFEDAFEPVKNFAKSMVKRIEEFEFEKPKSVELQFGIKLSGKVNLWVVSGQGEGSLSMKLSWDTKK